MKMRQKSRRAKEPAEKVVKDIRLKDDNER
jgi:hypothetical protein